MDGSGRVRRLPATSVWHVYTPLAIEHGAVNLGLSALWSLSSSRGLTVSLSLWAGQGFPDGDPPEFVQQAACDAIQDGANQYARGAGSMALVSVVAERASADLGRVVDPIAEVLVCNGCTGALFATFQALLDDGDEVVVFEPLFDVYVGQIQMAGGVIVPVPLAVDAAGDWRFDVDLLGAACSDRTRAIVVNNPHNPTGRLCIAAFVATTPTRRGGQARCSAGRSSTASQTSSGAGPGSSSSSTRSTSTWSTTGANTSGSPAFPACGTGR